MAGNPEARVPGGLPVIVLVGICIAAAGGLWLSWKDLQLSRKWDRWRRGLCPRCGYDLRASSGHCPECGRAIRWLD